MTPTLLLLLALAAEPDDTIAKPPEPSGAPEEAATIRLAPGIQKVITVPDVARVGVGDPSVFEVKALSGDQFLLVGLAEGESSLLLFDRAGRHRGWRVSVKRDEGFHVTDVQKLLRDSPAATVRVIGERIFVEGLIRNPDEFRALAQYPQVVVFAKLDPAVVEARIDQINRELTRRGLTSARAVLVGRKKLVLEGAVGSEEERRRAELIARSLFDDLLPWL
ncbi:MAG: pilus assembly protein N-terminal domain-containing protein [Myxococcales bacterium]